MASALDAIQGDRRFAEPLPSQPGHGEVVCRGRNPLDARRRVELVGDGPVRRDRFSGDDEPAIAVGPVASLHQATERTDRSSRIGNQGVGSSREYDHRRGSHWVRFRGARALRAGSGHETDARDGKQAVTSDVFGHQCAIRDTGQVDRIAACAPGAREPFNERLEKADVVDLVASPQRRAGSRVVPHTSDTVRKDGDEALCRPAAMQPGERSHAGALSAGAVQHDQEWRRARVSIRFDPTPVLPRLAADLDLLRSQVGRRFEAVTAQSSARGARGAVGQLFDRGTLRPPSHATTQPPRVAGVLVRATTRRTLMEIGQFQELMDDIYGLRDRERGLPATVAWLAEEVGELAQAVRKGDAARREHELGDVLAWLASLANQLDLSLDEAASRYARGCPRCGGRPCACP